MCCPNRLAFWLFAAACCGLAACAADDGQHPPELSGESRLRVAAAAEAGGDEDMAASMYLAAAARAPSDTAMQLRCAQALARAGRIAEARELVAERLKVSRGDAELLHALAVLDLTSGRAAAALGSLDAVLAARPDDQRALVNKAIALDLLARHQEAQQLYRTALRTAPEDAAIRNDLAMSMLLEGRIREATAMLAPLQDVAGAPKRTQANLGLLYALDGDSDQSRRLIGDKISDAGVAEIAKAIRERAQPVVP